MTEHRRAILAFCLVFLAGIAAWWGFSRLFRSRPLPRELTAEEALKIAGEVMRGERPEADLKKYGIRLGKPITGEPARKHLLDELEALEKSKQDSSDPPAGDDRATP